MSEAEIAERLDALKSPGSVTTCIYDKHLSLTGILFPDGSRVSYPYKVEEEAKSEENANGAKDNGDTNQENQ